MKCDPALHVVHVRVSVIRSSAVVTLQFMPDMFLRQLVVSLDRNRQVICAGFLPISVCVYNLRMVCVNIGKLRAGDGRQGQSASLTTMHACINMLDLLWVSERFNLINCCDITEPQKIPHELTHGGPIKVHHLCPSI